MSTRKRKKPTSRSTNQKKKNKTTVPIINDPNWGEIFGFSHIQFPERARCNRYGIYFRVDILAQHLPSVLTKEQIITLEKVCDNQDWINISGWWDDHSSRLSSILTAHFRASPFAKQLNLQESQYVKATSCMKNEHGNLTYYARAVPTASQHHQWMALNITPMDVRNHIIIGCNSFMEMKLEDKYDLIRDSNSFLLDFLPETEANDISWQIIRSKWLHTWSNDQKIQMILEHPYLQQRISRFEYSTLRKCQVFNILTECLVSDLAKIVQDYMDVIWCTSLV